MNFILFTTIIAAVSAAQLPSNNYLPSNQGGGSQGGYPQNGNGGGRFPGSGGSGGNGGRFPGSGLGGNGGGNGRFPGGSGSGGNGNTRPQQEAEKNAQILKQDQDINDNGFHYSYETSNGIRAEEAGDANQSQGGFSYQGDDGNTYSIVFTAGEGGFRPQGDHLPVAPPTPEAILQALEQNAKDEAAGIFDDGIYRPDANGNGGNDGGHGSGSGYLSGKGPGSLSGQGFPSGHGAGSSSRPGFGSSNHQGGFNPSSGYSY